MDFFKHSFIFVFYKHLTKHGVSILQKDESINDSKGYQCLCCTEANMHTLTTNMYPSPISKTLFSFHVLKGTWPRFTFQEKFTSIA